LIPFRIYVNLRILIVNYSQINRNVSNADQDFI
jgi:hypothetical protein